MNQSPEVELLLKAVRTSIDVPTAQRIVDLLQGELDWSFLTRVALRHRLVPLLHQNLSRLSTTGIGGVTCDPGLIPWDIRKGMQEQYALTLRRNLYLTGQLFSLLEHFQKQGISALPYKGPVQAFFLYGNLTSRQFMDLDILVAPHEAKRALQVLMNQGFGLSGRWAGESQHLFLELSQIHECALYNPVSKVTVELHWRLEGLQFSSSEAGALDLRKRLIKTQVQGRNAEIFAPNELLLLLASHGVRHLWFRLHWLCDLAQLLRLQDLNWEEIIRSAQATGKLRGLLLSLLLCHRMFGSQLPAEVHNLAQNDSVVQVCADQLLLSLFREDDELAITEQTLLRTLNDNSAFATSSPAYSSVALPLGNHLMGAALPERIAFRDDAQYKDRLNQLQLWLTQDIDTPSAIYHRFQLQIRERPVDRWRYMWWTWVAPGDKELGVVRLPPQLRWLGLPLRIWRLAIKYGTGLVVIEKVFAAKAKQSRMRGRKME